MAQNSFVKYSFATVFIAIGLLVAVPFAIFFVPPELFILLAIPFFIALVSVIVFGFKGIFTLPYGSPYYKIIRILVFVAPVVGIVSGPMAYFNNSNDPVYLVIYPIGVTIILETVLGVISKVLAKRFMKANLAQTESDIYEPVQQAAQSVVAIDQGVEMEAAVPVEETQSQPKLDVAESIYPAPRSMSVDHIEPTPTEYSNESTIKGPGIGKIIIGAILFIIGAIVLSIIIRTMGVNSERAKLQEEFASKVQECGTEPIVVYRSSGFGSVSNVEAYQPGTPGYSLYSQTVDFQRSGEVLGYYCTAAEVRKAHGAYIDINK